MQFYACFKFLYKSRFFLLQGLTTRIVFERPEKPLEFIVQELEKLKQSISS